jgi:hypothetical protein
MTTAREVLDAHTTLYERLKYPPAPVLRFYEGFFTESVIRSLEGSGALLSQWLQMFVPARTGTEFLDLVRRPLYGAPTYRVRPKIVDVVTATYEATLSRITHLSPADLPSESGFAWFDAPVTLRDQGGYSIATRAISWAPQYVGEDFVDGAWPSRDSGLGRSGIRLTSYSHVDDADAVTVPEMADRMRGFGMPLSIAHSAFIPFDIRLASRTSEEQDVTGDDITRWAHTLWIFMGTEIVGTEREVPERPARRRAQRAIGTAGDVQVVQLRHVKVVDRESGELRDVDWTCSWFRQAHWRHLDSYEGDWHRAAPSSSNPGHCVVCDARVTHVRTHVCDPAGKPLKIVPDKLFEVSR